MYVGPRYFAGNAGEPEDYDVDAVLALCAPEELEVDIWYIKAVRFDSDDVIGHESRRAGIMGKQFVHTLAHKRRCMVGILKARQVAIDLAAAADFLRR